LERLAVPDAAVRPADKLSRIAASLFGASITAEYFSLL
jgi:hypothetical protein